MNIDSFIGLFSTFIVVYLAYKFVSTRRVEKHLERKSYNKAAWVNTSSYMSNDMNHRHVPTLYGDADVEVVGTWQPKEFQRSAALDEETKKHIRGEKTKEEELTGIGYSGW